MFRYVVTLCASLVGFAAFALDDNISQFTLDNGMDVIVIEDHRAPVATHLVYYRVGAADEEAGKSGLAHYVEHLLFKGTETRAPGEFGRIVAENGGSDNAFTSFDYTGYYQRIAKGQLALMMEMEADRMVNLTLTDADTEPELKVVIEERRSRTDTNPNALFGEQRQAAQYLNHPYARPIVGWYEEVSQLTRADAEAFYKQHYAPDNAILIVAGDVEPDEVLALAKHYYGVIPPAGIEPRLRPPEPSQLSPRRISFEDPRTRQPYVIRTYLAPERDPGAQETAAALTLLAELLGGSPITSHFAQDIVFGQDIAVSAVAFYNGTSYDDTTFGVYIVPKSGVALDDAEAAMDQSIADFLAAEIDVEQLDRIKAEIRAARIYGLDDQFGRARSLGRALTAGLTLDDYRAWPDVLQAVTPADIKAAAEMVFDLNASVTGHMKLAEAEK